MYHASGTKKACTAPYPCNPFCHICLTLALALTPPQACPQSVLTLLPYAVPVLEERLLGGGPGWGPAQLQASAEAAAAGIAPAALPKVCRLEPHLQDEGWSKLSRNCSASGVSTIVCSGGQGDPASLPALVMQWAACWFRLHTLYGREYFQHTAVHMRNAELHHLQPLQNAALSLVTMPN